MKKILLVSPASYTAGGKARFTQMLYDTIKNNRNLKVKLLNTIRTKTVRKQNNINIFGYKHVLHSGIKRNLEIIINSILFKVKFMFCLLFFKPDFVQVHTSSFFDFWDNSIYIILSKLFYFQTILRVGDGAFDTFYLNSNKLAKKIFKKIISMVDKLVVQTVYWDQFFKNNNLKKDKIFIIPNFVDLKYWSKIKERTFDKNKEFNIIFLVGIDEKVKGYYDLMPAFSELSEKINIKLTIAGLSKKVEDEYKMLIEKKKLIVLDYISGDEKLNAFQNANVFILPTYLESFPNSIVEAMAAGLPIITTNIPQLLPIVENDKNALLVNPGNKNDIKDAIYKLYNDSELCKKLSENNKKLCSEKYDLNLIFNYYNELYKVE